MAYKIKIVLKDILEARNLTQKELAKMSGLRETTISDIARGTRTGINFEHIAKIAEVLEIDDIGEILVLMKE